MEHISGEDIKIILDFCSNNKIKSYIDKSTKIFDFCEIAINKDKMEGSIQIDINDKHMYFFIINTPIEHGEGFIKTNDLNELLNYIKKYID